MKKFTGHGREASRPLATGKGNGCGAHGARPTDGEKLGRKSCYPLNKNNGGFFNWSMGQNFLRTTRASWKAVCRHVLRPLSNFLSCLLSLCKALPTWFSQGAWKPSSYRTPSADDATTDRTVKRFASQKRATGRVPRRKVAKGALAFGAAKGTSLAGKANSPKRKTGTPEKGTVDTNGWVEHTCKLSSFSVSSAIEPGLVSVGPEGDWETATSRRGKNRVGQERLHSSREDSGPFAPAQRKTSAGRCVTAAAAAAAVESLDTDSARTLATSNVPTGAAARATSFTSQNGAAPVGMAQSSTSVVKDSLDDAKKGKVVPYAPASAAALPAADGNGSYTAVSSNDSFFSGHTLHQSGSKDEKDDGFTLATSRTRKPTFRKWTSVSRHLRLGPEQGSDSAGRHKTGEALKQSQSRPRVTVEENRDCFSRADLRNDLNLRHTGGTRKEMSANNNAGSHPSSGGGKRLFPSREGGVYPTGDAADCSVLEAVDLLGVIGEERLEKGELAAGECLSLQNTPAPQRLEQRPETSTEQRAADRASEHLCQKSETGQGKVITIPEQACPAPPAQVNGTEESHENTQGEGPQKKEIAGGSDSSAATSTSEPACAVEEHTSAAEQNLLLSPVEETPIPGPSVSITTQTAAEGEEVTEKIQEAAQQQPEQPKRWGDHLSDEEDDVCSWGSRDSGGKLGSCFPFAQISAVSPNVPSEDRERSGMPVTAKQATPKIMPQRRTPGFRNARGLHASTGERGLSKRHERQREPQHVRICSREQDRYQKSRTVQRPAEFQASRHSPKGSALLGAQASRTQQETPDSLRAAEADAAACWPPLSNAIPSKSRKLATIPINGPAARNLTCPFESAPGQRSSYRHVSATYSRRPQLQHVKWHPAAGVTAEEAERSIHFRNGENRATATRVQGSSIWRVRDRQHPREVIPGEDANVKPPAITSPKRMAAPCNGEPARNTTPRVSKQQESASFIEDQNFSKKRITKFASPYVQRVGLSSELCEQMLPSSVIPATSTTKHSGRHNSLLGRAGRRRARNCRRRWDHYGPATHSTESFHSHVLQQPQTTFYSYGVPPPPPPPPPPIAYYSAPRTYPSTGVHPYEDCPSQPVPPELFARGILLPHHQQHQQQQLMGQLHIYSDPGTCYVPVPYSTPAALYDAQQQLEYRCAWVYPHAKSVTSQTKAKEVELEKGEAGSSTGPHNCKSETKKTDPHDGGRSEAQRKHMHKPCDTLARETREHEEALGEREYEVGDLIFNDEELPQEQRGEHQEQRQQGQLPQEQQHHEEEKHCQQSGETKTSSQSECEPGAAISQICLRENSSELRSVQPAGRSWTSSNHSEDEDYSKKAQLSGIGGSRAAVVSDDKDACLHCDETSETTAHEVQKCRPVVQEQQHRGNAANSSHPPGEMALATPINGTLAFLCQGVPMEKMKAATAPRECADTATALMNVVATPERKAHDHRDTRVCPAAEQQFEKMRVEETSDDLQHSRGEKKQAKVSYSRNEVADPVERKLTNIIGIPPVECRNNAESVASRKSSGSPCWNDSSEGDKKMYAGTVSASESAGSEKDCSAWEKGSGCETPSEQLQPETNTTSQLCNKPYVQPKFTNADPDRLTQTILPERRKAAFDPDQHESAPQKEEARAFPDKIDSLLGQEGEDAVCLKELEQPAQGTEDRERTEGTYAVQSVLHKTEDSVSAGEIPQHPLENNKGENPAASKISQQCVQQRKEEKSLPGTPVKDCTATGQEVRFGPEKPSPQQEPRGEELLVHMDGGSGQLESGDEDRAVHQQARWTEHTYQTKSAENPSPRSSTDEGKRVPLSTDSGTEAEK